MIELKLASPSLLAVALLARIAELAAMRILGAVAIDALLAEFLRRYHGAVAGITIEFGMYALQLEVVSGRVIQARHVPEIIVVAIAAFSTEARRVRVVGAVTAVAILRNLVLIVTAAMTGGAIDPVVRAQQFKAGFLEVIVLSGFPLLGGMTFRAGIAACATMLVVSRVTTDAALRSLFVGTTDVTGVAGQTAVGTGQSKLRLLVVEFGIGPGQRAMAVGAGLCELAAMHIVCLVTTDACWRGLAKCFVLCMTGRAIERRMHPRKLEVGQLMIELQAVELDDICCAAFVLGMAGAALAGAGIWHTPVISALLAYIGRHILVAVQAQRRLRPHVRAVMAICAVGLLLDMRLADFARHQ